MKKSKGFTLIELLVVIAIIGILAAIVLVSLAGARDKARDARIQADISQIRSTAELYYDDHSYSYTDFCSNSAEYNSLKDDINAQVSQTISCNGSGDDYCISAVLTDGSNICVSDGGVIGSVNCAGDHATVCE